MNSNQMWKLYYFPAVDVGGRQTGETGTSKQYDTGETKKHVKWKRDRMCEERDGPRSREICDCFFIDRWFLRKDYLLFT